MDIFLRNLHFSKLAFYKICLNKTKQNLSEKRNMEQSTFSYTYIVIKPENHWANMVFDYI